MIADMPCKYLVALNFAMITRSKISGRIISSASVYETSCPSHMILIEVIISVSNTPKFTVRFFFTPLSSLLPCASLCTHQEEDSY